MAPVIFEIDVHCYGCSKKIRKAIRNMPGVVRVSASLETGQVVVEGTADAAALKARLEAKLRKPVTLVADGAEEDTDDDAGATPSPQHSPPAPPPAGPPMGGWYPQYGYGRMLPPPHYAPPPPEGVYYHPYGGYPWAMYNRQYMPNDAPTTFNDEDPKPCSIL